MTDIQEREKATRYLNFREGLYQKTLSFSAVLIILLIGCMFLTLLISSIPSIRAIGIKFFYNSAWDPVSDQYGALPFLAGTLLTSLLALIISIPFSLSIGLFLGEYFPNGWISNILKNGIELLAGIPSVIFGFWGMFTIVPFVRDLEMKLGAPPIGVGILSASILLAIMIIPYSASLIRLVVSMVPSTLKEGAYSLGATRFEVIRYIIIPHIRSGISAGILLSLGRALGETMAVTMLIGNTVAIPKSLFDTGNTMASVIANEFTEATGKVYFSALIEVGLFLFLVTTLINVIGVKIIKRYQVQ
ncbi:MAG: phosphate ABC transporter permease subunit PstC [Bacteroidota bacterium]|nr:phosphate ABC transporter permease subunit PstC [Bacteroidota bacterium]